MGVVQDRFWEIPPRARGINPNVPTAGPQGNNAEVQQDIIDAIDNIANTNIEDREYMTTLTQTVSNLTEELTKTQEKIVVA